MHIIFTDLFGNTHLAKIAYFRIQIGSTNELIHEEHPVSENAYF